MKNPHNLENYSTDWLKIFCLFWTTSAALWVV